MTNGTRSWLFCSLLLALNFSHPAAQAAEAQSDARAKASAKASEARDKPSKSESDEGTDGGFLPSEEISEDFAVSFPVDI